MKKEKYDKYKEDRELFIKALEEAICARFDRIVREVREAEEAERAEKESAPDQNDT